MKKFLFFLLFTGLTVNCFAAPIKPGEKISYKISKIGLKMGNASLTFAGPRIYNKQPAVLIIFKAQGLNFLDEEKIYVDPKEYRPLAVERNLNIFGSKEKITEEYIPGHIKITKIVGNKKTQQTIDKSGTIDNIYAFICRYRQQGTFKADDTLSLRLPTKDITMKLVRQETTDAAGKKYDTFFMESDPAGYKVWFDVSEKKMPLRINGAVKIGDTTMVMTKYEN